MSNVVQHCCRVLLLLSIAGTAAAQVPANVREAGTTSLLLLYKCMPENRPAFRSYLQRTERPRLRAMQKAGSLAEERILFSRYVDTENWDALIFLRFSSPQAASAWSAVEALTPAGLDAEGLRLVSAVSTYPLDLMQTGKAASPAVHPVYLVLPYDYTVSPDEYIAYLRDYVQPQAAGWIDEGVLESYDMYIGRDASGRPWSSILLLEYKDDQSFGRRTAVINDVRAKLRNNPTWKAISDRKQSVRLERASIIADEIDR
jgi:hypothetical protein